MSKNIRYKLTNQDMITYNTCQWTLNEWKETSGNGKLCSNGWLHCYSNPLLAILLNPTHANIDNPRLFEIEVEGENLTDNGLKEGWTRMRIVKELDIPKITRIQMVAFGILCALEVNKNETFIKWANNWLSGKDRSKESAYDAYVSVYAANVSDSVSDYDYYAADAAARSAAAANADNAANDSVSAYDYSAARSAADAAAYYADRDEKINLIEIAKKAMKVK